ncbi:hypothetical protein ScPMuIL_014337 [Solemya velum]
MEDKVENLKYNELRKLAKQVGIKSNHMKADKLVKALKDYYAQSQRQGDSPQRKDLKASENLTATSSSTSEHESTEEEESQPKPAPRGTKKAKRGGRRKTAAKSKTQTTQDGNKEKPSVSEKADVLTPKHIKKKSLNCVAKYLGSPASRPKSLNNTPKHPAVSAVIAREPLGSTTRRLSTPNMMGKASGVTKPRQSLSSQFRLNKAAGISKPRLSVQSPSQLKFSSGTPSSKQSTQSETRRPSWFASPKEIMKRQSGSLEKPNVVLTPSGDQSKSSERRRRSGQVAEQVATAKSSPKMRRVSNAGKGGHSSRSNASTPTQDVENTAPAATTALISVMKPDMTKQEMKDSLIEALDKRVKDQVKKPDKTSIPRFAAFLAKKKEQEKSANAQKGTPDWQRIHKKEFNKFDSLDVYLDKKRKRADDISASVKKARMMLEEVHAAVDKLKSHETPTKKEPVSSFFKSPAVNASKKTRNFKPTVTSTKNINLNFSSIQTPPVDIRKSPRDSSNSSNRRSTGTLQTKKSVTTPFRFNASMNTSLNTSVSGRAKFDLQASLSRPITWKSHKGKLKPLDHQAAQTSIKTPIVKTREDRRSAAMKKRGDNKFSAQMARRRISAQ